MGLNSGLILRVHPFDETMANERFDRTAENALHRWADDEDSPRAVHDRQYVMGIPEEPGKLSFRLPAGQIAQHGLRKGRDGDPPLRSGKGMGGARRGPITAVNWLKVKECH